MRLNFWLQNLPRRFINWGSRTSRLSRQRQDHAVSTIVEQLDQRRLLTASPAPVATEFLVNAFTTGDQHNPSIAMDQAGDSVVAWTGMGSGGYGIYAQRFNSASVPQGAQISVNVNSPSLPNESQSFPHVAIDATGDFVIAWSRAADSTNPKNDIYVQRFNADGIAQGAAFQVNSTTGSTDVFPSIAMDSAGDFVITWGNQNGATGYDVEAQRYNSAGTAVGGNVVVNTYTTGRQDVPSAAMDANGDFVIAWTSYGQNSELYGIYAQRFAATGAPQGSEFHVSTNTQGIDEAAATAMDSAGNFVIAWDNGNLEGVGQTFGVFAQRYNFSGVAQDSEIHVNTYTTGPQQYPSIAEGSNGNFVITWESKFQDGSGYGCYAQSFNAAGTPQGTEFKVNTFTGGNQDEPTVAIDAAGDLVLAWETYGQDGNYLGIYAQRYLIAGTVNHAPAGAPNTVAALENITYTFKAMDFRFSDPNDTPPNSLLAVKISSLPALGSLTDNGVVVAAGTAVSAADIVAGKLKFTPAAYGRGATYSNFQFQVRDNGGSASGGIDTDPTPRTMTLAVTPVNQAPIGTTNTVTSVANTNYTILTTDFGFTDPRDTPANSLLAVKITTLPAAGTLKDNGLTVSVNQLVSSADIGSGKLVFTPNANLIGGPFFLCKFQVEDNGGTSNGGVNLDPTPKILYVNIVKVNHAPLGTSGTVTSPMKTPYTFKTADFGFKDPNDIPPNLLLGVKITTLPGAGTLKDNGVAVTANQVVSAADISGGKLVFTAATNLVGIFFLCKFQVEDSGGTANGGVNLDPTAKVLNINIVHLNHAPVGTSTTLSMTKNTSLTFIVANFGFADASDTPSNILLSVKIATMPLLGSLTDNGVAVTAGAKISVADIQAGKLKYKPPVNASGMGFASFTFQVQDNGGTANGGLDTDLTPKKMTISVS